MDDVILREMKQVVEMAVRPVRATTARKRRMREELLAHLIAIFEEEADKLGDAPAALDQAKRRFGDPRELTPQLQVTVPLWDRLVRLVDVSLREPGEASWRFAGRIAVHALTLFAVPTLILMPVVYMLGRENEAAMRAYVLFCTGIFNIPLTVGFILLTDGMYRALYRGRGDRSWRLAAICALASLAFFPALAFGWCFLLTGNLALSLAHLRFACRFAPLTPVLFVMMARQAAESMRIDEDWASLEFQE